LNTETSQNGILSFTPTSKIELSGFPELVDLSQGDFNFLLFFGRLTNFFDIFEEIEDFGFGKILNNKNFWLIEGNFVSCFGVQGLPMSVLD
jgi:hypothetical protein